MSSTFSARPRRYLALWFPFLSADRHLRQLQRSQPKGSSPSAAQVKGPLVFIEKQKSALRIVAVTPEAIKEGLTPGLALADARARVPHLIAVDMDRAADADLLQKLGDFCDRYSPFVTRDGDEGVLLDVTGCTHLFGGEAGLRDDVLGRLKRAGLRARAAFGLTADMAHALVRYTELGVAEPDEMKRAVAEVPVTALEASAETHLALRRAGLKTIGDLATQPGPALAARFGQELVDKLIRLQGLRDIRIPHRRLQTLCMAERRFAEPIGRQEDIEETLLVLSGEAAKILEQRGEGGRLFEAGFFRADGQVRYLGVETAGAVRAPKVLLRLFREKLDALIDALDPGFGFDLIRLSVIQSAPYDARQSGLDSHDEDEAEVAALTDRLMTRFGKQAVTRFVPANTHIPERASFTQSALALKPDLDWQGFADLPQRPLHLFDTPQAIEALAEVPDGPPLKFRWRRLIYEIAFAEGPERIAAEWWHDDGLTRDYYRVEDRAGHRFWVFREGLFGSEAETPRWFLHGLFA